MRASTEGSLGGPCWVARVLVKLHWHSGQIRARCSPIRSAVFLVRGHMPWRMQHSMVNLVGCDVVDPCTMSWLLAIAAVINLP